MTAVPPAAALIVRVGARLLALDPRQVEGVARRPPLTRVPQAPPSLAGVGALKGRTTPVFELAHALGEGDSDGRELVLLSGDHPAALAVDRVEGLRAPDGAEWLDARRLIAQALRAEGPRRPVQSVAAEPAPKPAAERERSFLEFTLAGQRFAFALDEARAVIRAPAEPAPVPYADPVVQGLAPYREGVLPVVDLAGLVGLPPPRHAPDLQSWLIVVEVGGAPVGLRVERLLGALRLAARAVSPAPALLNRGAGEARVVAIARTASGLTAILAADRLFDEETTRRLERLAPLAREQTRPASAQAQEAFLLFRLGRERYALPAAAVEAVASAPADLSPPPNAPAFLAGVMAYHGGMFPLIDVRTRFGQSTAAGRSVIFLRGREIPAGLLVDAVERLAHLPARDLEPAPPLVGDAGALFAKAATVDGAPLLVADPLAFLGQARRDLLAWTAARA